MSFAGDLKLHVRAVADFFLPRLCAGCNKKLTSYEEIICTECQPKLKTAGSGLLQSEYQRKFSASGLVEDFFCLYLFEKDKALQHIIHNFKYNKRIQIGVELGRLLGSVLKSEKSGWKIDLIIPIPLHHLKKAERGFNQSLYVAKGISKEINLPVKTRSMKRKKFTETQTKMNLKEREANVSGAFKVRTPGLIKNKNILLVDDVITTGATIKECAQELKKFNAGKIYAASIAIAE